VTDSDIDITPNGTGDLTLNGAKVAAVDLDLDITGTWTFDLTPVCNFLPSNPSLAQNISWALGVVSSGGAVLAGRDISCVRTAPGVYTVTFPALSITADLFVHVSVSSSIFLPLIVQFFPISVTEITVLTYNPSGVSTDAAFTVSIQNLGA